MPTEIVPGVYDITVRQDQKRYRVFLFDGDIPTLVDSGFPDTIDTLADALDEIGTEPERLIITHGDGDHIGGFDGIVDRWGVETYLPQETTTETDNSPDHRYSEGDQIGQFTAVYTPGHEPDHYSLVDETARIAVMGDAASGADQRGLPKGQFHLPPAVYTQDLNQAEESLEKLLDYDFETALVYHGSSILENAHAKLDRYINFPGKPA